MQNANHQQQLRLFTTKPPDYRQSQKKDGAGFYDPSFASNKTQPVHRWVSWIAGFSGQFVRDAITTALDHPGTVLDPFAGVGTTLLEAVVLGHDAVGFEINPYAAMACETKLHAYHILPAALYDEIARFEDYYGSIDFSEYAPVSAPPVGFKTRTEFYSPEVLNKVLALQDFIPAIQDPRLQALFRLAFATTMVQYSNYSYEPSLSRRSSSGKSDIEDFAVGETIVSKLAQMAEDIQWLRAQLASSQPNARVVNESFFSYASHLSPRSVDLIVTSPPYLNNYHYNRNTRPQLYWLGYAERPADLKHLEDANFGKFWQTVREEQCVDLKFCLPNTDIGERLEALRRLNPEKGIYGGNGWANYAASYFNDCLRFSEGMSYVLKPGGRAIVVIGNSILQGVLIPTDQYFGYIAESVGLELIRIDIPRDTRVGNSIIQSDVRVAKAGNAERLYEAVVELRKR